MTLIKILFLTAMPIGIANLNLQEEYNSISQELGDGPSKAFDILGVNNVSKSQLIKLLISHQPDVFHYSGAGGADGLLFQDSDGKPEILSPDDTSQLFKQLGKSVRLVILNSCNSHNIAKDITKYVDCAIGMDGIILDPSAILFSKNFYMSIASGMTTGEAFDIACLQMKIEGDSCVNVPKIFYKDVNAIQTLKIVNPTKENDAPQKPIDSHVITPSIFEPLDKFRAEYDKLMMNKISVEEFFMFIYPQINKFASDPENKKKFGETSVSSLRSLLINLSVLIQEKQASENTGDIPDADVKATRAKIVASKIIDRVNSIYED